jgi:hypothetical protein
LQHVISPKASIVNRRHRDCNSAPRNLVFMDRPGLFDINPHNIADRPSAETVAGYDQAQGTAWQ